VREVVGLELEQFLGWGGVWVGWVAGGECAADEKEGALW
jgi:hypothetical protein